MLIVSMILGNMRPRRREETCGHGGAAVTPEAVSEDAGQLGITGTEAHPPPVAFTYRGRTGFVRPWIVENEFSGRDTEAFQNKKINV